MMHDREKSDSAIVAGKLTNKAGKPATESVEPRAGAEGNASQQSTHRAQYRRRVSQALERVRQVAVRTRGGSRMREIRSYGSVRGAVGNDRPYRERRQPRALFDPLPQCPESGLRVGALASVAMGQDQTFESLRTSSLMVRSRAQIQLCQRPHLLDK